jgi:hypothetical protein
MRRSSSASLRRSDGGVTGILGAVGALVTRALARKLRTIAMAVPPHVRQRHAARIAHASLPGGEEPARVTDAPARAVAEKHHVYPGSSHVEPWRTPVTPRRESASSAEERGTR